MSNVIETSNLSHVYGHGKKKITALENVFLSLTEQNKSTLKQLSC